MVQALRIAERQRLEEHAVHDGEDGAVGADAQRERRDGDGREPRRAPQRPDGVADVLP